MKKITIIGFGRFGKTLYSLLCDDFEVTVYNRSMISNEETENLKIAKDLADAYKNDVIFFAVPISAFEKVISNHKKYFRPRHLLIDVLGVKSFPQKIFEKYLTGLKTQAILTHPIFGPDSADKDFSGLPIVMNRHTSSSENFIFWKNFFQRKGLRVVEMDPIEHDKMDAYSHGLTHFIGRLLKEFEMKPTPIDTLGAKRLQTVIEQTCGDSWELFSDMQHYNKFAEEMRIKLVKSYDKLSQKLLGNQANPGFVTIGIQGGRGSFNEEAILEYIKRKNIKKYIIKYLHTSKGVLKDLVTGKVDFGQFATHNSTGGMVLESIEALARYRCKIVEEFEIIISHALMIRTDAKISDITSIMTHPQVLAQCKKNLAKKYPSFEKTSGKGKLIDHALVAKKLGEKKLPKHIATMGSKILADIYGLKIAEEDLQDLKQNYTSFLIVER